MKFKDHSKNCDLNSEDSFDASRGCDCRKDSRRAFDAINLDKLKNEIDHITEIMALFPEKNRKTDREYLWLEKLVAELEEQIVFITAKYEPWTIVLSTSNGFTKKIENQKWPLKPHYSVSVVSPVGFAREVRDLIPQMTRMYFALEGKNYRTRTAFYKQVSA